MIWLFDQDDLTEDDNMGIAYVPIDLFNPTEIGPTWYSVQNGDEGTQMFSKNATGDIQVKVGDIHIQRVLNVVKGNSQMIRGGTIHVSLKWALEYGLQTDLDTSCIGIDSRGNVLMDETVYFGDLCNSNGSIRHSGDQSSGGKDEIIRCNLDGISRHVRALYFLLTIATPGRTLSDVKSASVEVTDSSSGYTLCRFTPISAGENTAMFLMRIARDTEFGTWKMKIIDETDDVGKERTSTSSTTSSSSTIG